MVASQWKRREERLGRDADADVCGPAAAMASSQMVDIVLVFEESSFKIYIDLNDPAALFFTQVYLATSVWPPRQKITGFMASDGQVTIAPLQPDADFKTLNIRQGMTLTLEQCVSPPGTPPPVFAPDRLGTDCGYCVFAWLACLSACADFLLGKKSNRGNSPRIRRTESAPSACC